MRDRTKRLARAAAAAVLALGCFGAANAETTLSVITTTPDLASIAREIGGDHITVESLAKGYQDPHFVDAKPSYLLKLRKADLFIEVGRDLEVGWAPGLLNNARNARIRPGGPGFVDASTGVSILEADGRVGREAGDVHPLGNPHYWLNPENGLTIAANVRDALERLAPTDAPYFRERYAAFESRLKAAMERWKKEAVALGLTGMKVVTYHRSWPYFAAAFGLDVVDYVEPRPGVPPAPRHVQQLIDLMKAQKVGLLIVEPYFDPKLPARIAQSAGVAMVVLPPSVGASPAATGYLDLFDAQFAIIRKALGGGKS